MLCVGMGEQSVSFDAVDIFHATTNKWSTASLSAARSNIAATSLPTHGVAIFAGSGGTLSYVFSCSAVRPSCSVTKMHLLHEVCLVLYVFISEPFKDFFTPASNTVDIFNAATSLWSTAVMSVARGSLAATSLPNLGIAIFAGGMSGTLLDFHTSVHEFPCAIMSIFD
jgi:hypothetical protein